MSKNFQKIETSLSMLGVKKLKFYWVLIEEKFI